MNHKIKNYIINTIVVVIILTGVVLGLIKGIKLSPLQKDTLLILAIVCSSSALFCFVVGEISDNNSQMDKLWSILPLVYTWIIAIKGEMKPRLIIMAVLTTLWGIRLTINFARKGAYSIKFWTGKEDYRWKIVRNNSVLKNRLLWAIFDLLFISIYQNLLVLLTTLPALAVMEVETSLDVFDFIGMGLFILFLAYETIADEIQWKFQSIKWKLIDSGKQLSELDPPYNYGFNTVGLWNYTRHPNYLGEQGVWVSFYLFTIGKHICHYQVFHWSIVGSLLLILLFMGSSSLAEKISSTKYPLYQDYCHSVLKYIPLPWKKYRK